MVVLPILIGTNLTENGWNFFRGKHPDFDHDWYPLIGRQIAITMLLYSFQPSIDFAIAKLTQAINRYQKSKFVYKGSQCSNKNDILIYLEMNAGPEYQFYY